MIWFILGFAILAVVCLFQGSHYLQRAELFETDPNFRDRANRVRLTAYFLNVYALGCGIGAIVTCYLWLFA